ASTATEAADGDPRRLCWVGAVHEAHPQSHQPFAGLRCQTSCNDSVPTSPTFTKLQ
ncbi:Lysophospholipase, partial [Clarias magur]